jgi:urea transport system substrate-binding protein
LLTKAPSGFEVVMDLSNHHLHKPAVIGRITADARIVPIWVSQGLIAPEPWSPWLEGYESEPLTAPRWARELAPAS